MALSPHMQRWVQKHGTTAGSMNHRAFMHEVVRKWHEDHPSPTPPPTSPLPTCGTPEQLNILHRTIGRTRGILARIHQYPQSPVVVTDTLTPKQRKAGQVVPWVDHQPALCGYAGELTRLKDLFVQTLGRVNEMQHQALTRLPS